MNLRDKDMGIRPRKLTEKYVEPDDKRLMFFEIPKLSHRKPNKRSIKSKLITILTDKLSVSGWMAWEETAYNFIINL